MSPDDRPTLLAIQHVPWETPAPDPRRLRGARRAHRQTAGRPAAARSRRGGRRGRDGRPDETSTKSSAIPELATEREWLAEALRREMPVLGICLGAQLLARALGAEVRPGERPEIGFAPVEILDPDDPILGALAPSTTVLHWHGDVFDLPDGASSPRPLRPDRAPGLPPRQRLGRPLPPRGRLRPARGLAGRARDGPTKPARRSGDEGAAALPRQAEAAEPELIERTTPGLRGLRRPGRSKSARRLTPSTARPGPLD